MANAKGDVGNDGIVHGPDGINNAFNHRYVSSVVINAPRGRYYEPAPGRNVYLGMSIGAGR